MAVGIVVGAGSLMATLVYLPGGLVAQLGHQKWQMVLQHGLAAVATGSFGFAGTWWQVLPGVALSNAAAVFSPATNSYLARAADADRVPVPTIFTALGTAQYLTMTLSPPLGGLIADHFGMAALFPLVFCCYGVGVAAMCLVRSQPVATGPVTSGPADDRQPGGHAEPPAPAPVAEPGAARRNAWEAGMDVYGALL